MADWRKIKTEYITGNASYRKLAEKHGVHYKAVSAKGKAEGWVELREQHRAKTITKSLEKISDQQADKMARIDGIADKLLDKLEQAVTELDMKITTRKYKEETETTETTTEWREAEKGGIVDRVGLRQITAALRDLKEIKMIQSELDRREQEARIANLQKQAQKDDNTDTITVVLEGDLKKYAQ